jgi:hypothetical protein
MKKFLLIGLVLSGCIVANEEQEAIATDRSLAVADGSGFEDINTIKDTIQVNCVEDGNFVEELTHVEYGVRVDLMTAEGSCLTDLVVNTSRYYPKYLCEYHVREGEYITDIFKAEKLAETFSSCNTYSRGDIDTACSAVYGSYENYVSWTDTESCMK